MGNALKIRKTNDDGVNGTNVDQGYPNNGTTNNGFDGDYPGVVGGVETYSESVECQARVVVKGNGTISASSASTTVSGTTTAFTTDAMINGNTQILIADSTQSSGYAILGVLSSVTDAGELELLANSDMDVTDTAWYYSSMTNAMLIRQKGSSSYMVALVQNIQDESITPSQAYFISNAGNTNWAALGASTNAVYGDVFTATASGYGLTTTGTVWPVSTCLLVDESAPGNQNTMSINVNSAAGTVYASRLKNHFAIDFDNLYVNANPGNTYIATFFTTSGTPDDATGLTTAAIENWC